MRPLKSTTCISTYHTQLINRRKLSEKAFEVEFTRPCAFEFSPGQRIRLIHENIERDYSLICAPEDATLSLCIRKYKDGQMSSILATADIGSWFHFAGSYGYFLFRPSIKQAVFVATGTGIAPFVSMARSKSRGFIFLHGVSTCSELYYKPLLKSMVQHYIPCVSDDMPGPYSSGEAFSGRVTQYLEHHLDPGVYDFYLCGKQAMIKDVMHIIDSYFSGSLVYTERFD
jgi:NAD(P)H-flavin reductase